MAHLNPARRTIHLDTAEFDDAVDVARAPGGLAGDSDAARRLRQGLGAAGLLVDGRVADIVAELLGVMARPALQVVMETHVAAPAVTAVIWGVPARGMMAQRQDGWVLSALELKQIPFAMAGALGFGSRPPPALEQALEIPGPALRAAWSAAETGERRAVEAALMATRALRADERRAVADVLVSRRSSWRVTVTWNAADGSTRQGALAVVDGGEAGLWETAPLKPEDPEDGVRLTPRRANEVWRALLALVPAPG